jgi:glycosyltransferase involved in cell wall biosynthesis
MGDVLPTATVAETVAFDHQRQPTSTVIICAYTLQRWDDTRAAVRSVQEQQPPPEQLLIVVDHNEELRERLAAAFPSATVVANTAARGLSGARNTGLSRAAGDIVIFLDDDARAHPGWLAATLKPYQDAQVAGVAGYVEPQWAAAPPSWLAPEFYWVVGCSYTGLPTRHKPVRNPIGANMSFRRTVFDTVGVFTDGVGRNDEVALPMGCEETEFGIRVGAMLPDSVIVHEPEATVSHRVDASRATWRYFFSRCYAEGMSKAAVAHLVGAQDALLSERSYVRRTLPLGVARDLRAFLSGDAFAVARVASILLGTLVTGAGYAAGSQQRGRRRRQRQGL